MRKSFVAAAVAAFLTVSSFSSAEETKPNTRHVGGQFDVGAPDGAAFGIQVKPAPYWILTGLSATYNGFAPGIRGSIKLDPIKYPIRFTLTTELGHSFEADLASVSKDLPRVSYTYINFHPGIEIGSNNGFSFFLHAGASWMDLRTSGFDSLSKTNNYTISDPHAAGLVMPTVKLGVVWMFL